MSTPETVRFLALVTAAQARIAGMQAANMQRQTLDQAMAYVEEEFFEEAYGLEQLAIQVIQS